MADALSGCSAAFVAHVRAPRHVGALGAPTHRADADDAVCGDRIELDLRVEAGRVVEVRQRVVGCHGAVAVGSALAALLPGREARPDAVSAAELEAELDGVPGAKRHALRLATDVLRAAFRAPTPRG